jgi:hypothetical protein
MKYFLNGKFYKMKTAQEQLEEKVGGDMDIYVAIMFTSIMIIMSLISILSK